MNEEFNIEVFNFDFKGGVDFLYIKRNASFFKYFKLDILFNFYK